MAQTTTTRRELLSGSSSAALTDTDRLSRLLSVELLLLYAYDHVITAPVVGPRAQRAMTPLAGHEQAHVAALRIQLRARGATVVPPPTDVADANRHLAHRRVSERLGQLRGAHDALRLLLSLERVVVGAYFVALTKLSDPHLIGLVAQIMASDAQHEAIIGGQLYPGDIPAAVPYGLVQGVQ